jgi:hypothetical protein
MHIGFMNVETTQQLESRHSLSLLDNGIGLILKGIDEVIDENHAKIKAKVPEIRIQYYKYGITKLFSGFMLLVIECLSRQVPNHFLTARLSKVKRQLQMGKRLPIFVDLDDVIKLLEIRTKVIFTQDDIEVIRLIQGFRNQFEQYKVSVPKYQLLADITKFVDISENFLHIELGIELDRYSNESRSFHQKANALRKIIVRIDRTIEMEFLGVIHALSEKEIPGKLLGSDGNIFLPTLTYSQKIYETADGKYIPAFEGDNNIGMHWIIEVKGAYIYKGGIHVLKRLLSVQNQSPKNQTWFISLGEISNTMRDFALQNHIYITDIGKWGELKHLSDK